MKSCVSNCGIGRTRTTGTTYGNSMGSLCDADLYILFPLSIFGVDLLL